MWETRAHFFFETTGMRSKAYFMLTLLVLYQVAPTIFSITEALFTFTRVEQILLEHAREQVCIQVTAAENSTNGPTGTDAFSAFHC